MATIVQLPTKLITVSVSFGISVTSNPNGTSVAPGAHTWSVEMNEVNAYLDSKGLRDKVFLVVMEDKQFGLRFEHASDAAMFKLSML